MSLAGKMTRKTLRAIGFSGSIKNTKEDAKLLETIRKNVEIDADATGPQRALELDDLRFCDPTTQWEDSDRKAREQAGRPCLTEDRLGPFLMQVCNEQRKNKPGVQVNPVDSGSDIETAEVLQGLIRHIEYASNADTAYDTAFEWAVRCGRGFYRVCTDYVDQDSFEQEVQIKRIPNPHMVFCDPAAQESDYSDMNWAGIKAWVTQDDFKAQYPNAELAKAGSSTWLSVGDDAPDWMSEDAAAVLVVEYFWKEHTRKTIKEGEKTREAIQTKVKWVKATAIEILERGEFASRWIPIIPVLGKEMIQDGVRTYAGLVRAGKDPQKRHNYLLTSQVERIAFMPLATWVGAKGFMGKNRSVWQNAHKNQMAALEYEVTGDEDKPINAPRLITEEAPIVAVTNALRDAEQGMKGVLGMYDANMGNRQGGESGIAIQRLQTQGETGNFHFQDNLSRALRHEGRIILDLVPTVYDTERIIRIIGEDGTQSQVKVNGAVGPDDTEDQQAVGKLFDLTTGKYDVTVSAGPSYQSKRQEDRAMLLGMLQGPMGEIIAQRAGDLVAKTLDSPIAKELAERLVPPDIAAKEQQGQGQQVPPQLQQQMQAMAQQHEQLVQALHAAQDQIDQNTAKAQGEMQKAQMEADISMQKAQLDSQTKLAIAQMNNETELMKVQAQLSGAGVLPEIQAHITELEQSQEELAQLALHLHEQANSVPEPQEPEEPAPDPIHGILQQHGEALASIGQALHRLNAPKKIILDAKGSPVGVGPADEGAE